MDDVKRCHKCGKALEVSHMVLGKLRTHPCACLCEIARFEREMKNAQVRRVNRGATSQQVGA